MWLGPLIALFGLFSYFTIFYRWPFTRDFPWVNLTLLALGVWLSVGALRRAWPRGGWRAAVGAGGTVLSLACAFGLISYAFVLSYSLPDGDVALGVGEPVPSATLPDQEGRPVSLVASPGERVILVFYRGHW